MLTMYVGLSRRRKHKAMAVVECRTKHEMPKGGPVVVRKAAWPAG